MMMMRVVDGVFKSVIVGGGGGGGVSVGVRSDFGEEVEEMEVEEEDEDTVLDAEVGLFNAEFDDGEDADDLPNVLRSFCLDDTTPPPDPNPVNAMNCSSRQATVSSKVIHSTCVLACLAMHCTLPLPIPVPIPSLMFVRHDQGHQINIL